MIEDMTTPLCVCHTIKISLSLRCLTIMECFLGGGELG